MARMIELQRNYSASAKMVSAMQQIFDELLRAF
jgi:flagellar hook-associated protein FlgK